MNESISSLLRALSTVLVVTAALCPLAQAEPLVPKSDAEVIEVLPAAAADRSEERRLRRQWSANPRDATLSLALAKRYLDQARELGDPRYVGQAMAVLQAWPDIDAAPDEVLLMAATLQQYLHDFDTAAAHLEKLVARNPRHAQAWLTLATVRRVQGRYAESDKACVGLTATSASLYARACKAENDSLRGDVAAARAGLKLLLATPRLDGGTQNWLLTTLAEVEERDGNAAAAEAAFRAALKASPDSYTTLSYADFLLLQKRDADALAQLATQPRTDAVLLRLGILGARSKTAAGLRDAQEVRDRTAQANLRPEAKTTHAREAAMLALWIDGKPQEAVDLAMLDLQHQREPLDLVVLAQAARAAKRQDGLREVARIKKEMGLHDRRLDALL